MCTIVTKSQMCVLYVQVFSEGLVQVIISWVLTLRGVMGLLWALEGCAASIFRVTEFDSNDC